MWRERNYRLNSRALNRVVWEDGRAAGRRVLDYPSSTLSMSSASFSTTLEVITRLCAVAPAPTTGRSGREVSEIWYRNIKRKSIGDTFMDISFQKYQR